MQDASEDVQDLNIKKGERQFELKSGTLKKRSDGRRSDLLFALDYGVSDSWATQFSLEYQREPGQGLRLDSFEWENRFRLTDESWNLPLSIGFLAEIDYFRDHEEGYQLRFGPLLQKDLGNLQLNANLLFERHLGETPSRATELGYQWQTKYHWSDDFQFGLQGFGDVGQWDDWAPREDQSHRFGPAVFGEFKFSENRSLEYDAAYLTDPSSRARSHGIRLQLRYRY